MYGASRPFARAIRARGESYATGSAGSGPGRVSVSLVTGQSWRFAVMRAPVVTAPCEAEPTSAAYLAMTPVR